MGLGYSGYAQLGGSAPGTGGVLLLANTTGLEVKINPIYSTAVFGRGWYNASAVTFFADNMLTYEGPIEFDLQGSTSVWNGNSSTIGNSASGVTGLKNWAFNNRAYPQTVLLSPDGSVVYSYIYSGTPSDFSGAWCQAMSLNFSPEAMVKADVTAVAIKRTETMNDTQYMGNIYGIQGQGVQATNFANPSPYNLNPIPGWNSRAAFLYNGQYLDQFYAGLGSPSINGNYYVEVMDYNIQVTNNTVIVKACNGTRIPAAVLQGTIDTTGSCTLYREGGIIDPVKLQSDGVTYSSQYLITQNLSLGINIGGVLFVKVPYALISDTTYGVKGTNEVSTRTFSWKGIGDGANPPITFPSSNPLPSGA